MNPIRNILVKDKYIDYRVCHKKCDEAVYLYDGPIGYGNEGRFWCPTQGHTNPTQPGVDWSE